MRLYKLMTKFFRGCRIVIGGTNLSIIIRPTYYQIRKVTQSSGTPRCCGDGYAILPHLLDDNFFDHLSSSWYPPANGPRWWPSQNLVLCDYLWWWLVHMLMNWICILETAMRWMRVESLRLKLITETMQSGSRDMFPDWKNKYRHQNSKTSWLWL